MARVARIIVADMAAPGRGAPLTPERLPGLLEEAVAG